MNVSAELLKVARGVVWFKPPEETLADSDFFLAHVMTYGTIAEVVVAKKYFGPQAFQHALENAPPGVFDPRSWACWNTAFDRVPIPPLPQRAFCRGKREK